MRLTLTRPGFEHFKTVCRALVDPICETSFLLDSLCGGELAAAESHYREALETSRGSLGDEDPLTLVLVSNIATVRCFRAENNEQKDPYLHFFTDPPPMEMNPSNLPSEAKREPALKDRSVGSTSTSL